jgi:hypothetical protein
MIRLRSAAFFSLAFALLTTVPVQAGLITYTFTGSVLSVDPALAGTFNTSQTLTGTFTYDDSAAGTLTGTQSSGVSSYFTALTAFVMTVGPYTATLGSLQRLNVGNNISSEDFVGLSSGMSGPSIGGNPPVGSLLFDDPTELLLSDTLLTDIGNLGSWPLSTGPSVWQLSFGPGAGPPELSGWLTSATLSSATPEPSTFVLFSAALAVFARRMARRSKGYSRDV